MVTTEYLLLHLHEDLAAPLDGDDNFIDLMKTVRRYPGCERLLWGHSKDDPKKVYWIIDWTTLADHEKFMKEDMYPGYVKQIKEYTGPQGMEMLHFEFSPFSPFRIITPDSQVLEILAIDLKSGAQPSDVDAAFAPFQRAMAESGVKSIKGTSIENANKVVAMLSWASVDAHMAARENDSFKSTIGAVRNLWENVTMNHVQLEELNI